MDVQSYWNFRGDITYLNGLVLKGDRITIPSVMRTEILSKIHERHLGADNAKGELVKVYFGLDSTIK